MSRIFKIASFSTSLFRLGMLNKVIKLDPTPTNAFAVAVV